MNEVDRAVEWIDDPSTSRRGVSGSLLGENAIVGPVLGQQRHNGKLRSPVNLGDRIKSPLARAFE